MSVRDDGRFMLRALELALEGWGQTSPNPMVGAVVVRDGEIVGEGAHRRFGGAHAEVEALGRAASSARGATLYVTLEPCSHHGQTPPCTEAIAAAGIARVLYAVGDPNPEAAGGAAWLRERGIVAEEGPGREEAWELNAPFFHAFASDRPWITLKLAVSLDGAIADHTRLRGWLTGEEARREVHRLRAASDAIGVGASTVFADDPQLTVRGVPAPRRAPLRIVFSRTGRLPVTSRLAQTAEQVPVLVLCQQIDAAYEHTLTDLGVEVATAPTLTDGMRLLFERGIRSLLVEGGADIAGALLREHLVDRLAIFQAPVLLGSGGLNAFSQAPPATAASAPRLRLVRRVALGDDLLSIFAAGGY